VIENTAASNIYRFSRIMVGWLYRTVHLTLMKKAVKHKRTMKNDDTFSFWNKLEAAIFPIAAAIIGIGYTTAIFANNNVQNVLRSPHAIILIAILLSIAFFPIRSVYRQLKKPERESQNGADDSQSRN